MTNKEYILDCLIDDSEAEKQIIDFFKTFRIVINIGEIKSLIQELIDEGLIFQDNKWVNEFGEKPYTITDKGREAWKKITTNE